MFGSILSSRPSPHSSQVERLNSGPHLIQPQRRDTKPRRITAHVVQGQEERVPTLTKGNYSRSEKNGCGGGMRWWRDEMVEG